MAPACQWVVFSLKLPASAGFSHTHTHTKARRKLVEFRDAPRLICGFSSEGCEHAQCWSSKLQLVDVDWDSHLAAAFDRTHRLAHSSPFLF